MKIRTVLEGISNIFHRIEVEGFELSDREEVFWLKLTNLLQPNNTLVKKWLEEKV